MATLTTIFVPSGNGTALSVTTHAASLIQTLSKNQIFAINATEDVTIKFGLVTVADPTGVEFRIPTGTTATFDLGDKYDSFKVYNLGTSTASVYYLPLSHI